MGWTTPSTLLKACYDLVYWLAHDSGEVADNLTIGKVGGHGDWKDSDGTAGQQAGHQAKVLSGALLQRGSRSGQTLRLCYRIRTRRTPGIFGGVKWIKRIFSGALEEVWGSMWIR